MKAAALTRKQRWEREVLEPALAKSPERNVPFTTISGRPIDRLYSADDVTDLDYQRDLSSPGEYPYTRGIHPSGYRGKLWTMRQFAGFGTPEETNERYKTLLVQRGSLKAEAFLLRRNFGEQFRILDAARLPESPVAPNRLRITLLGMLVGLVLGLLAVAIRRTPNTRPPALAEA